MARGIPADRVGPSAARTTHSVAGQTDQTPQTAAAISGVEFRKLLEILPVGAYACDAEGLITWFNQYALKLWGREPRLNDPVDRYCGSFKLFAIDGTPIRHDQCWMALALQTGREYLGQEILIERPDGYRIAALAHASPIQDAQGNTIGAVNVLVDISERKRAEEALRQADRHKDEFLAILAHELRNPLAPMRNALHVMRLAGQSGMPEHEARTILERQLRQLVRLIDDLSDVSRITRGRLELRKEHVDIAMVLQAAIETARPALDGAAQRLTVSQAGEPLVVEGDPVRLAQVFANLLNNAARYSDRGGQIWLTTERQGSDVLVRVRDSGVGIPPDMLPRVFDMFTQVQPSLDRPGGLGVGLTIVKRLVAMHGGTVEARSEGPGHGSEFVVRLPLALGIREQEPIDPATITPAATRHRILVVDDDPDSAGSLATLLKMMKHDVRVAHDGHQALSTAVAYRPDVVLLDIGLPRLSGYEVATRIRGQEWGKSIVLIALTGYGQEEDKRKSRLAGFNLHLVKPVEPAALEKVLASL